MWRQRVAGEIERAATGRRFLQGQMAPAGCAQPRNGWLRMQALSAPVSAQRSAASASAGRTAGRDDLLRRIESVLFLAREPLSSRRLCQYANLADATEARTLIRRLNNLYDQSGRAFRVEEVAGGFRLLTRAQFARWLRRLSHVPGETRFSTPALETLAVVAYRQPIGRADIEAVRGVNCGEILRQLIERDLVRISGRSEELGRPYLYGTTSQFLQLFGLKCLDDLPRAIPREPCLQKEPGRDDISPGTCTPETSAGLDRDHEEEPDVSATFSPVLASDELLKKPLSHLAVSEPRCGDEDEEFEDEDDDEFEDDEDEDDYDDEEYDEEEDFDDEDDEDDDEDDEDFEDEDFEDEDWEEVDDDEEEEEEEWEDDDEDLDWEDDDEDDEDEADDD